MPRNNQQDTASWDAREVRRAEEHRPRKKRRRRVRLIPYLLFVLVISAILAGSGWLVVSEFCSFNRAPVEAEVESLLQQRENSSMEMNSFPCRFSTVSMAAVSPSPRTEVKGGSRPFSVTLKRVASDS